MGKVWKVTRAEALALIERGLEIQEGQLREVRLPGSWTQDQLYEGTRQIPGALMSWTGVLEEAFGISEGLLYYPEEARPLLGEVLAQGLEENARALMDRPRTWDLLSSLREEKEENRKRRLETLRELAALPEDVLLLRLLRGVREGKISLALLEKVGEELDIDLPPGLGIREATLIVREALELLRAALARAARLREAILRALEGEGPVVGRGVVLPSGEHLLWEGRRPEDVAI